VHRRSPFSCAYQRHILVCRALFGEPTCGRAARGNGVVGGVVRTSWVAIQSARASKPVHLASVPASRMGVKERGASSAETKCRRGWLSRFRHCGSIWIRAAGWVHAAGRRGMGSARRASSGSRPDISRVHLDSRLEVPRGITMWTSEPPRCALRVGCHVWQFAIIGEQRRHVICVDIKSHRGTGRTYGARRRLGDHVQCLARSR